MKLLKTTTLCAAVLLASGLMSSATLAMRLTSGATVVLIQDQSPLDANSQVGVVGYVGAVGPIWFFNTISAVSKPVIGDAANPHIELNSFSVSSDVAFGNSSLLIEVTDTGFTANNTGAVSIGGTTDGSVTARTYVDPANVPFAQTILLRGQGPFGPPVFHSDDGLGATADDLYSLTLVATVTHPGPGIPEQNAISGFDSDLSVGPTPPQETANGCRVTGGGRQQSSTPSVRFVTHGGQVGAPVGTETAFAPDTPCIQGNWEHVRHMKNGNKGNFHAKSFDSLMCACLGCPEDPTAPITLGGLCNPGARTCGPEPRKAPANKITFSGVGDFTEATGKRETRSVVFRVDIEDRGEPGNSSAGGSEPPNDRHRIRIWILTAKELKDLNNPANQLLAFRKAISASFGTSVKDGAPGPNGSAVFGVRAPDIDDGGEMDHGNHQIHPSIKPCP